MTNPMRDKMIRAISTLWLLVAATPAMAHGVSVESWKYAIVLGVSGAVAITLGLMIGRKRLLLAIVVTLMLWCALGYAGLLIAIVVSL